MAPGYYSRVTALIVLPWIIFYLLAPEPTLLASVMSADVLQVLQWMVVFVIWIFLVTCVEPDELPLH